MPHVRLPRLIWGASLVPPPVQARSRPYMRAFEASDPCVLGDPRAIERQLKVGFEAIARLSEVFETASIGADVENVWA